MENNENTIYQYYENMLRQYVDLLDPRKKEMLGLLFGLDDGQPKSPEEVSKIMGIPFSKVSYDGKIGLKQLKICASYVEDKLSDTNLSGIDVDTVMTDLLFSRDNPYMQPDAKLYFNINVGTAQRIADFINAKKENQKEDTTGPMTM